MTGFLCNTLLKQPKQIKSKLLNSDDDV